MNLCFSFFLNSCLFWILTELNFYCLVKKLQKWSKGKQKEKVNNLVLFDNATFDKLCSEAAKQKVVTAATLSERFRV